MQEPKIHFCQHSVGVPEFAESVTYGVGCLYIVWKMHVLSLQFLHQINSLLRERFSEIVACRTAGAIHA